MKALTVVMLFALCMLTTIAAAEDFELCKHYDLSKPVNLIVMLQQQKISSDRAAERKKTIGLHCESDKSAITYIQIQRQHDEDNTNSSKVDTNKVSCQDYSDFRTCSEISINRVCPLKYPSEFEDFEFGVPFTPPPGVKVNFRIASVNIKKLCDALRERLSRPVVEVRRTLTA